MKQAVTSKGRVPPRLLAPLLYHYAQSSPPGLSDVVPVANDISAAGCCTAGPGFDAASGWGVVNFAAFTDDAIGVAPTP